MELEFGISGKASRSSSDRTKRTTFAPHPKVRFYTAHTSIMALFALDQRVAKTLGLGPLPWLVFVSPPKPVSLDHYPVKLSEVDVCSACPARASASQPKEAHWYALSGECVALLV
jgi:hypothetical protein